MVNPVPKFPYSDCLFARLALPAARGILTTALLCLLTACAGKKTDVHTRDDFTSKENAQGVTHFSYTMSWYLPVDDRRRERQTFWRQVFGDGKSLSDDMAMTNESWLYLEERAVSRLKGQLKSRDMCASGHKIDQTQWLSSAIRLSGRCL